MGMIWVSVSVGYSENSIRFCIQDGEQSTCQTEHWQTELAVQSPSHGQFFTAHRLHHARLLCPSLSPGVCPSSCQIPYDYTVEVTNGFKGLDIMDRVPKELWTEVHNIIQEAVIKTIPKKKKCKKEKWLSEQRWGWCSYQPKNVQAC